MLTDSAPFLLPTLQIFWAIIAFAQSTVTQNWHLYLLRAITGFLEASSFGGTHLIRTYLPRLILPAADLCSWKLVQERRTLQASRCLVHGQLSRVDVLGEPDLGSIVLDSADLQGYLQAAIFSGLNGVAGRAGWQWQFIVRKSVLVIAKSSSQVRGHHHPTHLYHRLHLLARSAQLSTSMVLFQGRARPRRPANPSRRERRYHLEDIQAYSWPTDVLDCGTLLCVSRSRVRADISFLCQAAYWTTYMSLWLSAEGYSVQLRTVLPTFVDLLKAISSWLGTTLAGSLSLRGLFSFQCVS